MDNNSKTKILIIGSVIGLLVGGVGALILLQQAERNNTTPQLTAGEGVKVGLGVLAVLKLLADLGSR